MSADDGAHVADELRLHAGAGGDFLGHSAGVVQTVAVRDEDGQVRTVTSSFHKGKGGKGHCHGLMELN